MQPTLLLLLSLLLHLLHRQLPLASGQQMPKFVFTQSPKLLLVWNDVWEAGSQNSLVLLTSASSGNKITVRVRLDGIPAGSGFTRVLTCKCPTKASTEEINLDSLSTTLTTPYCQTDIPFSLRKSADSSNDFELTMGASQLTYVDALTSNVVLGVRVQYSTGTLQSNSLSMWNLDPISAFPPDSLIPLSYERHFLTENAINLLTGSTLGSGDFNSFQFIDNRLTGVLQSAPEFFRQKLNLGGILNFDSTPCSNVQYERSMAFVTYDSKLSGSQVDQLKTAIVDRSSGVITYARCPLYRAMAQAYVSKGSPTAIGICAAVTVSGEFVPYARMTDVRSRMTPPSFPGCSTGANKVCQVVPGVQQNVTIYSGTDSTQLLCPIVCDDSTMVYKFYFNDQQLLPPTGSDWSDWGALWVRVSRYSNVVEIGNGATAAQAGVYRCSVDTGSTVYSFSYYVTVVAMPSFSGSISGLDAALPQRVFAMQGESLSYSCAATQSGLSSSAVTLEPQFYLPSLSSGGPVWRQFNLAAFNGLVSASLARPAVSTNVTVGGSALLLNLTVRVPPPQASFGYNFTHRLLCNASVAGRAAQSLGLASYSAQTGSDVLFVPRPTRGSFALGANNDCAAQKCYLGNGALFQFGLSAQYGQLLSDLGVQVSAYLRIDNLLLTDVRLLVSPNVSVLVNNASNFSLTYRLLPIANPDVRAELLKYSSLTPVFNLRYSNASAMGNVNLLKAEHGPPTVALGPMDCRADPLCFYSTDFDTSGNLSFLSAALDFKAPVVQLAGASLTAMIVVIVVCVLLIIVLVIMVVYFANRAPAKTYHLEEKEIAQGHNPNAEAKDEQFKEYTRPSDLGVPENGGANSFEDGVGGDFQMIPTVYNNDGFYESLANSRRALGPHGDTPAAGYGHSDEV